MQTVSTKTLQDTMYYRAIAVFTYQIDYPHFSVPLHMDVEQKVNQYYILQSQKTEHYCHTVLFPQAVESARYIQTNRPPFYSYQFQSIFQVTLNQDCITSLYMDQYEYMGGAHGSTLRLSDTWNLHEGVRLTLDQFYPSDPDFSQKIFRMIEIQIAERLKDSPSSYFDNYAALIRQNFHPENFYLKPEGIIIYYQQYDIAPYSTGIPTFTIPFQENFPTCH